MAQKTLTVQEILWQNVQALMKREYGAVNQTKFWQDTGIGAGGVTRIKEQNKSVGLETLVKISKKFDLQPWHLLLPGLDVNNPPVISLSKDEKLLYENMKKARELLI